MNTILRRQFLGGLAAPAAGTLALGVRAASASPQPSEMEMAALVAEVRRESDPVVRVRGKPLAVVHEFAVDRPRVPRERIRLSFATDSTNWFDFGRDLVGDGGHARVLMRVADRLAVEYECHLWTTGMPNRIHTPDSSPVGYWADHIVRTVRAVMDEPKNLAVADPPTWLGSYRSKAAVRVYVGHVGVPVLGLVRRMVQIPTRDDVDRVVMRAATKLAAGLLGVPAYHVPEWTHAWEGYPSWAEKHGNRSPDAAKRPRKGPFSLGWGLILGTGGARDWGIGLGLSG